VAEETVKRLIDIQARTTGVAEATQKLDALSDAHQGVAQAAEQAATATEDATQANSKASASVGSLEKRLEGLQRKYDVAYRAQAVLKKDVRDLDKALAAGRIDSTRHQALVKMAEEASQKTLKQTQIIQTAATKAIAANDDVAESNTRVIQLGSHQWSSLRSQAIDAATMLSGGSSPFQVMSSQSGQVIEALGSNPNGIGGSLKGIGQAALGLVNPFTIAFTAIAATVGTAAYALVSYSNQIDALEKSLRGRGMSTSATVGQLNEVAKANANAGNVSTRAARDMTAAYASTGQIGLSMMGNLVTVQREYAKQTGQDLPEATAELAKIMADPAKGAALVAEKFGSLGDKTRQLIERQQESGDLAGAQKTLFDALNGTLNKHAKELTGIAALWDTIKTTVSEGLNGLGSTAMPTLEERAAAARRALEDAQRQRALQNAPRTGSPLLDGPFQSQGGPLMGPNSLQALERQALRLESDVIIEQAIREMEAREAQAREISERIGDIVRSVNPEIAQLDGLKRQRDLLQKGLSDPMVLKELGVTSDQARAALEKLNVQITAFKTTSEQLAQSYDFAVRSITAQTTAEKAQLAYDQALAQAKRDSLTPLQQATEAERARNLVLLETSTALGESLRQMRDEAKLIGASPMAQRQGEIANRFNEMRRLNPGNEAAIAEMESIEKRRAAYEMLTKPMEDANRALDEQTRMLDAQQMTLGGTTAQIRAAEEAARLWNEAQRQGITEATVGTEAYQRLGDAISAAAQRAGAVAQRSEILEKQKQQLTDIKDLGKDALKGFVSDLRQGKSFAEAFTNVLDKLLDKMLDMLINSIFDGTEFNPLKMITSLFGGNKGAGVPNFAPSGSGGLNGGGYGGDPYSSAVTEATTKATVAASKASGDIILDVLNAGKGSGALGAFNFGTNYKTGVDGRLTDILQTAAQRGGFKVDLTSGFRPGDPRFHGQGLATDVKLFGANGQPLPNYQDASAFRQYELFAQQARQVQMEKYPELADDFRWGGYFSGGKGKYGAMDPMHFDLGGNKVGMGGGSWENGLSPGQRMLWPGANSRGMGPQAFSGQAGNDNLLGGSANDLSQNFQSLSQSSQQLAPGFDQLSSSLTAKAPEITQGLTTLGNATGQGGEMVGGALQNTAGVIGQGANGIGGAIQQLGQALTSGGGGGGGFGGLLNLFGGGGGMWGSWMNNTSSWTLAGAGLHSGGLVGRDRTFTRHADASLWSGAPRFHDGMRPDEVPAILQRGEWVLSKGDVAGIKRAGEQPANSNARGGYGGPRVVVNNHGPTDAHAEEREDGTVEVYVDALESKMAGRAARGKGPFNKALQGRQNGKSLRG
jgi:hypothetical protein